MANFLERDFQTKFRKYCKYKMGDKTFAYELKATKQSYLNFNALAKHQEYALLAAKHGIAHHKISDEGVSKKPFDGFQLVSVPAYVGIMFNTKDQQKTFYLIDIDEFLQVKEEVDRKSLTEEKAAEIGEEHQLA